MDSIVTYVLITPLIFGWLLDLTFGDPEKLPHPIVLFGKWISTGEKLLNKGSHRKLKGAIFALFSIIGLFALSAFALNRYTPFYPMLLIKGVLIFFCLAGYTLRKEVRMVFEAADISLEKGRQQVARIVGRDTQQLSDQEVRTAALETLAENLSDGVIAPLFWYLLLGVPGMLTYKMVNTLDSMIGYQNERYKDFGCWAAHIDDMANYVPARITALIMILAGWILGLSQQPSLKSSFIFLFRFSSQHASPNSGWPEAALASILDCRFGGPHNYFGEYFYKPYIGTNPRKLTTTDMKLSIQVCFVTECAFIALACLMIALS